ncbi:MAG: hypothetical protein LKF36_01835 [Lactobacillus sp.]|jgi:hypothetical protein|nr:hypothetical protein [Lactobacillus sp.]
MRGYEKTNIQIDEMRLSVSFHHTIGFILATKGTSLSNNSQMYNNQ